METVVLIIHVLLAAAVIGLILLQQGKGAEAGASFGAGTSQTVFGSSGSGNFLSRMTGFVAAGIFATSFVLAIYAKDKAESISDAGIPTATVVESQAPAVPTEPQLPALEAEGAAQKPAESDIPKAD
ncbi:preprotein translocase subunit SecG [Neptuniibacter pectenicola]|uniref:Protein-export membrane protein SecG n=1 Tax=Neptuniibacter pectenicola TaxID=1806669 RepID=A0ABU9TVJ2_9GAMM